MQRRYFFSSLAANALVVSAAGEVLAFGEKNDGNKYGAHPTGQTRITGLGGMSLQQLRDFHVSEIEKEYLPTWDNRRIDRQYGGVRPFVNPDGTYRQANKRMYYLGRAIWVFSYLYNHFGQRREHLEIAERTIDFIYKHGRDSRGYWYSEFTREGEVVTESIDIYGDIYVVLGLGEYYKATGDSKARDIAIDSAHKITERIVSPSYSHPAGHGQSNEPPGTKRLGTWQHFLSALTPLAKYTNDYGVGMMARMCVQNIVDRHWQPDLEVFFEQLDDQYRPFPVISTSNNRIVSGWHSIQAAWMVMDDMLRTGDRNTFMRAMEMGRLTLEKCWIDNPEGESGLFSLDYAEGPVVLRPAGSPWGSLDDSLVYAMLAAEHTHAQWAIDWFDKIFKLSYTHPERQNRICLLHHPRRLFYVTKMLDRMIAHEGKVSEFLRVV